MRHLAKIASVLTLLVVSAGGAYEGGLMAGRQTQHIAMCQQLSDHYTAALQPQAGVDALAIQQRRKDLINRLTTPTSNNADDTRAR
jgi:hypothetical protein